MLKILVTVLDVISSPANQTPGVCSALPYTGCSRRNGPDVGRVFLMLNYTENPQNTYIQS